MREVLRRRRGALALSALGGVSHQACEALVPVLIGVVVQRAIEPGDAGALGLWIAVLACLFVVLSLSYRLQVTVGVRALEETEHELRLALVDRILDPAGLGGDGPQRGWSSGALVSVAGTDARRAALVLQAVVLVVAAASALVVAAVVLLRISVGLGLLVLLGAPPLLFVLQRVARPLWAHSGAEQARAAQASAVATDFVRGVRVLKGIGAETTASERYRDVSRTSLRASLRAARAGNVLDGASVLVSGALLALVAYVGGRLALDGTIDVGELVAALGLSQFLLGPLQRLGYASGVWAQARASADRVAAVLDAPPALDVTRPAAAGGPGAVPATADLRLDAVQLPGAAATGTLDLAVAEGERLGVVVADPALAAALVDLLARRRAPDAGRVVVGDVALHELPLAVGHRHVLVADHDADLFAGTVGENVGAPAKDGEDGRLRRRSSPALEMDDPWLQAVLAASGADEVVASLPDGLDAPIGERGQRLSGGQRQRVALARALAADAPVLVLHEPTTAVDAVTEARVAAGLRRLRAQRTTVMITASPALLAMCDRVVLVADGTVVAEGSHATLARDEPAYRELVLA